MLRFRVSVTRTLLPVAGSPFQVLRIARTRAFPIYSRHASNTAPSSPTRALRTPLLLGAIAGGVLGYHFFWPSESRHAPTLAKAALSSAHFTPVTVTTTEPCADGTSRLITLTVPKESLPPAPSTEESTLFKPVWSIFIKDDDIQVERPYTPLEGIDADGNMSFWIKKYEKGEVARWLHTKRPGEHVEIRGPIKTWPWQEESWDEIIMISGGTGITSFYQLLHSALLSRPSASPKTRFTLLHSSRIPSELPPPSILRPLLSYASAHPEELEVSLFVDFKDGSKTNSAPMEGVQVGRVGKAAVRRALGRDSEASWWQRVLRTSPAKPPQPVEKRTLVLVCGPEPMINAIAGPYGRNFSQGPVGGVLGELGCRSDQVWKL